jgi:hypothetical protein
MQVKRVSGGNLEARVEWDEGSQRPPLRENPSLLSLFEMLPAKRLVASSYVPTSKLSFYGVSDKKHGHTGYFEYRLDESGRIWCRWDPVLAKKPFAISCSNKVEFPIRAFDAGPGWMKRTFDHIVAPYTYVFDEKSGTVIATPRSDLEGKGFILRNGKLVEVPLEEAQTWHLHDGTGGPKLPKGVSIVEFEVQNELLCARGSDGLMYLYHPGLYRYERNVYWTVKNGFRDAGPVRFPEGLKDWTMGVSTQVKPAQRRSLEFMNPWTDIDSYYGQGNQKIANAATITLGVIKDDGRSLHIWDTGLPYDLHRGFLTPDNGRVQAEKVAQKASTWVIFGYDRNGLPCLFRRLLNYENFGACIGMEHSLDPEACSLAPEQCVQDVGSAVRPIPMQGWLPIAFPDLHGQALITDAFSVHCTGEGDAARELRFEGRNAAGDAGYYYKGIEDSYWRFRVDANILPVGKRIEVGVANPDKATPFAVTRDYEAESRWSGLGGAPIANVSLLNFHPYQTQAEASTLRFTLISGAVVDVLFRTADAWSPFARKGFEDSTVGQGAGVPKILVGTFDIPKELFDSPDQEVREFVREHLGRYQHIPNLFEVIADLNAVKIKTSGKVHQYKQGRPNLKLPPCSFVCTRDDTGETLFERLAADLSLQVTPSMSVEQREAVVLRNQELQAQIYEFHSAVRKNAARLSTRWGRVKTLLGVVRASTAVLSMRRLPYVGALVDLLPRLISAHRSAFKSAKGAGLPAGMVRALTQIERNMAESRVAIK